MRKYYKERKKKFFWDTWHLFSNLDFCDESLEIWGGDGEFYDFFWSIDDEFFEFNVG